MFINIYAIVTHHVRMYVYIYIYIYIHVYIPIIAVTLYTYIYISVHTYIRTYKHIQKYTFIYTQTYTYTYTHITAVTLHTHVHSIVSCLAGRVRAGSASRTVNTHVLRTTTISKHTACTYEQLMCHELYLQYQCILLFTNHVHHKLYICTYRCILFSIDINCYLKMNASPTINMRRGEGS